MSSDPGDRAVCGLFLRRVGVTWIMATDSTAATGGRAGITFDVELVVPWDARRQWLISIRMVW